MADDVKRALILAGGGVKVAFQAGVLQVWLDEAGLEFHHADGASGGVFNAAMWAQGYSGTEIADRWRSYVPLRGIQPNVDPLSSLFRLDRFRRNVLRGTFALNWANIRATDREVTFNLYDFSNQRLEVRDAGDMDEDLLVSAVSLPMWFPPVRAEGKTYIDAVFATDANLEEAIRRGADELWVIWTVSERGEWRDGPVNQYFQIIEAAANSSFRAILDRIERSNAALRRGEPSEFGRPLTVHVLRAEVPVHYLLNFTRDRMRGGVELGVEAARRWCDERGIPRREPRAAPPPGSQATRVRFTEDMAGFVAFGEREHDRGARAGEAMGTTLSFRLTIATDDIDRFVADPVHEATAVGYVAGSAVGGRCSVERGRFQLFVHDADPRDARMRYLLWFRDRAGHPLTLTGYKVIRDDPGLDTWRDTTRLYTRLLRSHVPADRIRDDDDDEVEVVAAGILTITPRQFARQLTTFRASGPSRIRSLMGLVRFGQLFTSRLWDVYSPPARTALRHETAPGRTRRRD